MPPRASNAAKRQQGNAKQRDTRHENGMVRPGKRIQGQKSNGHVEEPARLWGAPSTPPLSATPPHLPGHARPISSADQTTDHTSPRDTMKRPSCSAFSEFTSSECHNIPPTGVPLESHRQIDVNAAKDPAVRRDAGSLSFALTVLRSCPLYDTIAILIVLLQIPPALLSVIHLLFASLTFVPPLVSASSGLSFTDMFEGNVGTPSVTTIVVVDLIVLLVWLFLWSPLQDIALDLAHTVIALTLGGGTSGRKAGVSNILVCFGIVGFSHLARSGHDRQIGLTILSSTGVWFGSSNPGDPLEPSAPRVQKTRAPGWIRSIVAIHILTQGVVRYIRDWYLRRETRDVITSIGDPEAAKGVLTDGTTDSSTPVPHNPDHDPSVPVPVNNTSSKKKKRQSTSVRIRQPLWAALASTKIVMVREYETSHAAAESAGTNATDVHDLGNAPFDTEPERIWISYVGCDEVLFSTSYFPNYADEKCLDSTGAERSKPFYVRINKSIWQPTRILPSSDIGRVTWTGEIFGLAPVSNYEVSFISTTNGDIIFSTSIRTLQPPALASLSPNPSVCTRPGSPTTTLKTSIATSELKLLEERSRLKRDRKDQRFKIASLRREIDKLVTNINGSGGNDDRLRQKVHQSQLHMKQAEDILSTLSTDIETLDDELSHSTTNTILHKWKTLKALFTSVKDHHTTSHATFTNAKSAAKQALSSLSSDLSSLEQKRERMTSRITKLQSEHERMTNANTRELDETTQRAVLDTERFCAETMYLERLRTSNAQVNEAMNALQAVYASIESLQPYETYTAQQLQQHSPTTSLPSQSEYSDSPPVTVAEPSTKTTPATSSNPWHTSLPSQGSPQHGQGSFSITNGTSKVTPWNASGNVAGHGASVSMSTRQGRRGRSSSLLSNVSGFTQSSGDSKQGHRAVGSVTLGITGSGMKNGGWNARLEQGVGSGVLRPWSGVGGGATGSEKSERSLFENGNENGFVCDPKSPNGR